MSLQAAAHHLASKGRGPDTHLVHMAPSEVAGLQALAKAHGGTLTINPETGLPEAGFLSNILPMVIGGALAATGVGAPMAAMLVGGGYGLATGSLSKGLMAGLGAYGGAGLGGALMGAGEAAGIGAAQQAAMGEVGSTAAQQAAQTAAPQIAAEAAPAGVTGIPGFQGSTVGLTPPPVSASAAPIQAVEAVQAAAPATTTQMPTQAMLNEAAAKVTPGSTLYDPEMASRLTPQMSNFEKLGAGVKNLGALTTGEQLKYGAMLGLPLLASTMEKPQTQYKGSGPNPYNFAFDWERPSGPSYDSREAAQLRGRLRPLTMMAGGGPVEGMSDYNQQIAMMANGGQGYAEGGETKTDVAKGMTGASADAFRYLMGQSAASPATQAAQNFAKPAPAAPTGFLSGVTGIASPEGVHDIATGQLTPWSATNPKLTGGLFSAPSAGASTGAIPDGMEVDPNQPYSFNFNPVTRQMTAAAPVLRPITTTPFSAYWGSDYGGGDGGGSGAAAAASGVSAGDASAGDGGTGGGDGSGSGGGSASARRGGLMALAAGGHSHLGDYSDGGRLLRGPGDGVSDSIPATIGDKRPARLADGEFVVPARIVSELGNGSTEAGARKLYAMMDRIQQARSKTTGKNRVAVNSRADKALPA